MQLTAQGSSPLQIAIATGRNTRQVVAERERKRSRWGAQNNTHLIAIAISRHWIEA
jgi:DNA-binding CsgD family transcriptional regulator